MNIKCFSSGFSPGSVVIINGFVHEGADRFEINLQCGPEVPPDIVSDIALHFNPRFDEDEPVMVRNTMRNGFWGYEEREGGFFFAENREYSIKIHAEWKGFKIVVDDFPFIYYKHRQDLSTVSHMSITGDFEVKDLCYFPAPKLEDRFYVPKPTVPHKYVLQSCYGPGSVIVVDGKVRGDVERFSVNLVCGKNPDVNNELFPPACIALHYDVRFFCNKIVHNSMSEGEWYEEEISDEFIFARECEFSLRVVCEEKKFKIHVNNETMTTYEHRMDPRNITYVYISGGIYLNNVNLVS